jgi:F-type H+-transporting ATPase subunit b
MRGARGGLGRRWAAPAAAVTLILTLAEGAALAAEGAQAGHGSPWLDLLYKAINFLVLVAIIYGFARKPVGQGLSNLAKAARESFLASRDSAQELKMQMAGQKQKLASLAQDLKRMVDEAKADVEREKQRALADAQAQAARIQAATQLQIEQEIAKARLALRQELAGQTIKLAEELIRQRMNPGEHQRLLSGYLKQLEAQP